MQPEESSINHYPTPLLSRHWKLATVLASLGLATLALVTTAQAASGIGMLGVGSSPAGVVLISPTCYTVSYGTCGVGPWTSTDVEGIPPTTYTFPLSTVISGLHYVLTPGHITGCNLGTPGSLGNQCRVSVARGALGAITATYRLLPPPPAPPCAIGAPNLVLNPSFESVDDGGVYTGSTNPLETWWYISTPATSMVPHWTRDNTNEPSVFNGGTISGVTQLAASGQRYAGMELTFPSGMRGVVTPAPTVGTTYVLSLMVDSVQWPTAGVVSLRLANSGSGAQSAVVYDTSAPESSGWAKIGGAVVATGYYNEIIVRDAQGGGGALVDDVKVCRAAANKHHSPVSSTTTIESLSTPKVFGQPVTFSASVATSAKNSTPTGVVQFSVNGKVVAVSSLSNGRASVSLDSSRWSSGNRVTIVAKYTGDPTHTPSIAHAVTLKVPVTTSTTTTTTTSTTTTSPGGAGSPLSRVQDFVN